MAPQSIRFRSGLLPKRSRHLLLYTIIVAAIVATAILIASTRDKGESSGAADSAPAVSQQLVVEAARPGVAGNAAEDVADGWITTKVKSRFMYSTSVKGSDVEVTTRAGIVTLTGKMDSDAERTVAIELARNVRGVKSVDSRLLTM